MRVGATRTAAVVTDSVGGAAGAAADQVGRLLEAELHDQAAGTHGEVLGVGVGRSRAD